MTVELERGHSTHPGLRRQRNEDAVLVGRRIFAVADGMGGHAAGDVASAVAVNELTLLDVNDTVSRPDLLDAIRQANRTITHYPDRSTRGMGTTITGFAITGTGIATQLVVFNVGDSRTYRLRAGVLDQLTHDHSRIQELVDAGALDTQDLERHPERNVVTRSLGSHRRLDIDWWTVEPLAGDRFLIASDGLSNDLEPDEIVQLLAVPDQPQDVADRLVNAALLRGGHDNISVIVVDILDVNSPSHQNDPLGDDTEPRERLRAGLPS